MVAMGKMSEFDRTTSFAAWAGQIVRFTALNELRRKGRAPRSGEDALMSPGAGGASRGGGGGDGVDAEMRGRLAGAMETLDDTARACLLMRTVMDMPYQEIGAALGIPEGTAMSHVHRSRQALRSKLMPYWQGEDAGEKR